MTYYSTEHEDFTTNNIKLWYYHHGVDKNDNRVEVWNGVGLSRTSNQRFKKRSKRSTVDVQREEKEEVESA